MSADDAIAYINGLLGTQFTRTFKGDELKGWVHDADEGGTVKVYLGATDCADIAKAFAQVAKALAEEPAP